MGKTPHRLVFVSLKKFSRELTQKYRKGVFSLDTKEHLEAYKVVRMPATKAAIVRVLQEIRRFPIQTLLDLGAGPATGWLAAKEVFPALRAGVFVEKDRRWEEPYEGVKWHFADLKKLPELCPHDLVLIAYALGEIDEKVWPTLLEKSFALSKEAQVIIEPGTPAGFKRILKARQILLNLGAHLIAPCPHTKACPMQGKDWCHFAARLSRTSEHRLAKEGTLGFEDEKFSYLIFSRNPLPFEARVVRPPIRRSGHVLLALCTAEGQIKNKVYSRSKGEIYKEAKKLELGDRVLNKCDV